MIIPAIIPETINDVEQRVGQVKNYVSRVQIDVADGFFAPTTTWPIINTNGFVDIVSGKQRLPYFGEIEYEIHLMVQDPMDHINQWLQVGVNAIVAHASMLELPHLTHKLIKEHGLEFGIAVTPIEYEMIDDVIFELADFVQVMGSNDIGKSGVALSNESVEIVRMLAKKIDKPIAVDIGVNQHTIGILKKAGATRFVSGSAVFESKNILPAISELESSVQN